MGLGKIESKFKKSTITKEVSGVSVLPARIERIAGIRGIAKSSVVIIHQTAIDGTCAAQANNITEKRLAIQATNVTSFSAMKKPKYMQAMETTTKKKQI